MPGVVKIVRLDTDSGSGFGVIAKNAWAAFRAAEAIEAEWGDPEYPPDNEAISKALHEALVSNDGTALRNDGDMDKALADAPRDKVIESDYEVPYLAHACMEPMNATARLKDGVLDVWSPNQAPTIVRQVCAKAVGVPQDKVNVRCDLYGRRLWPARRG